MEYRNLYVFDLDGTLCDITHRLKYIKNSNGTKLKNPNWERFFKECVNDEPLSGTIEILKSLQRCGKQVCICSGRSDEVQEETIEWLKLQGIDTKLIILIMRKDGDYRPDTIVKDEMLTSVLNRLNNSKEITWNPIIFEDRKQVVDMWRSKGFTCYQVAPGEF